MLPSVTIGICVKNIESLIKATINSIRRQDYPHNRMEIIFVDESNDDTLNIIKENTKDIDIPVKIFHVKGRGLGYSRNLVIKNSKGYYLLWVDGDMIFGKSFIRKLVKYMEDNPKIGIARGKQALLPSKNWIGTLESYSRSASRMVDYSLKKNFYKSLGTGGAIYRSEIFTDTKGYDERMRYYCEDWDFEIRAKYSGWRISITDVNYLDYEREGLTWKQLWTRYWRRGYYTHFFLHKHRGVIKHYHMFPLASIITGLIIALKLYKITKKRILFLLPLHYFYKMNAWYIGYIRSHFNSYEPNARANVGESWNII